MNHVSLCNVMCISIEGLINPDFILGTLYYDNGVTNTVSKGNITLVYSLCVDKHLNVIDEYWLS